MGDDLLAIVGGGNLRAGGNHGAHQSAIEERVDRERVDLDLDAGLGVLIAVVVGGKRQVGGRDAAGSGEVVRHCAEVVWE